MQKTASSTDLAWLIDDMVGRVQEAEHGIVLSKDGLLIAGSRGLGRDEAEHLSALAAGVQSLAKGVGERFGGGAVRHAGNQHAELVAAKARQHVGGGGAVRQTVIEMRSAYLIVTVAGAGACLAVLCNENADMGLVAYEMAMLVTRVGPHLTTASRFEESSGKGEAPR